MTAVLQLVESLINRANVTDVMIGPSGAWVDTGFGFERVAHWPFGEDDHRALAVTLIDHGGRHLDVATPFADVRLGSGVRVHAIIPPASVAGTEISIRVAMGVPPTLAQLEGLGMLSAGERVQLEERARAGRSFLIAGATGTGKTTLLAGILASLPDHVRIVTIEDVAELCVAHPHIVSLQARQANIEGAGEIGLGALVRQTLRMRPDWLVLGEMRGVEILDVLLAQSSGHAGGSTVHAGSLEGVAGRLVALGALAGLAPEQVARQVAVAIDDVYFLERGPGGRRLVAHGVFEIDARGALRCEPC